MAVSPLQIFPCLLRLAYFTHLILFDILTLTKMFLIVQIFKCFSMLLATILILSLAHISQNTVPGYLLSHNLDMCSFAWLTNRVLYKHKNKSAWNYNFVCINIQVSREEMKIFKILLYRAGDKMLHLSSVCMLEPQTVLWLTFCERDGESLGFFIALILPAALRPWRRPSH
jgi:hypothetical protein